MVHKVKTTEQCYQPGVGWDLHCTSCATGDAVLRITYPFNYSKLHKMSEPLSVKYLSTLSRKMTSSVSEKPIFGVKALGRDHQVSEGASLLPSVRVL